MSDNSLRSAPVRWLLVVIITNSGPSRCLADAKELPRDDDGQRVIRLEVTPADAPEPLFRHRLVYSQHERLEGNRPQWYLRSLPEESSLWRAWDEMTREDGFDPYYNFGEPIGEVDWASLDRRARATKWLLEQHLVPGSRRRECDWGIRTDTLRGPETISFLLPEFQQSRSLARMTALNVRLAIHEGRLDDALEYLRAQYQHGADVGAEPLLVCGLVGMAICGVANSGVTDLIAAPGSPNLYWALSELPGTPVPIASAMDNELWIGPRVFEFLDNPERKHRTYSEWNGLWKRSVPALDPVSLDIYDQDDQRSLASQALPLLSGLSGYTHAKRRLIDWGATPDVVEAMPVGQVLSLYSSRIYRSIVDDLRAISLVPFAEQRRWSDRLKPFEKRRPFSDNPDREIVPVASLLLPALQAVRRAEQRVARELAALRVIEACRMHAARNEGRLPRSLDDINCVPVPENPATGKPFLYHRDGRDGVLDLPDWEGFPGQSIRYEITIINNK